MQLLDKFFNITIYGLDMKKIMVTGGAGFIGSNFVDFLSKDNEVIIYDNFSSGNEEFLKNSDAKIIKGSILDFEKVKSSLEEIDTVYHLAANPDVKASFSKPKQDFETNVVGTFNVLEACRLNDVKSFAFTSSSTVYGDTQNIPTPESEPINPISNYAASKAASENHIMSYSHLYGIKGTIFRYANIIGPKLTHGVIYDFYNKLKKNPNKLEILGDGKQKKSYLHIKDCVESSVLCEGKGKKPYDIFNIGSEGIISVIDIANIICEEMSLSNVKYNFTGGRGGWKGDVPIFQLEIEKLKSLGWTPSKTIEQAIRDTVRWIKK